MRNKAHASLLVARRALLFAAAWLALAGPNAEAVLPGLVAVAGATWLSLRLLPPTSWVHLWRAVPLLPRFLWRSFAGGVDVARRAFDPRLPLAPGWVEVPSRLTGGGRAVLGGGLSLMPGSLAAGTRQGRLLVHCLDANQPVGREIAADEAVLARTIAEPDEAPKR